MIMMLRSEEAGRQGRNLNTDQEISGMRFECEDRN